MKVESESRKSLGHVWLSATPWTAAYQAPPSTGFSRQESWSGVPLPSPSVLLAYTNLSVEQNSFSAFCWEIDSYLYIQLIFDKGANTMRKAKIISINHAGTTGHHWIKRDSDSYFSPHTKITLKWIMDLNIKVKTVVLLGKKYHRRTFLWLESRQSFLRWDTESNKHERKKLLIRLQQNLKLMLIRRLIYHLKTIYHLTMSRQVTYWKKIFAKHTPKKRMVFRKQEELL